MASLTENLKCILDNYTHNDQLEASVEPQQQQQVIQANSMELEQKKGGGMAEWLRPASSGR
jgi:hypothetical protein